MNRSSLRGLSPPPFYAFAAKPGIYRRFWLHLVLCLFIWGVIALIIWSVIY